MELLNNISIKNEKRILGLMSGTSLDGLDMAMCRITGHGKSINVKVDHFASVSYPETIHDKLASLRSAAHVDLMELCLANSWLGDLMGEIVIETLQAWKLPIEKVDLIASHGQTVYHAPRSRHHIQDIPNSTLQIGDGDHLAVKTGILTLSDFRQKHTALGGEGAPLAAPADYLMFSEATESRILLNIGGIANYTWIPAGGSFADVVTTDTGPGNTLIDVVVREKFDLPFDRDGKIAGAGSVDFELLHQFLAHTFFGEPIPKTTGQELFDRDFIDRALAITSRQNMPSNDLVSTLTRLTADSIAMSVNEVVSLSKDTVLYVSGGGSHNTTLMQWLGDALNGVTIRPFAELGFDPDAKEAVLFAVLAYESLFGEGVPYLNRKKIEHIRLGKLSFPH